VDICQKQDRWLDIIALFTRQKVRIKTMAELIDKDEILKKAVTIPGPSGKSVFSVVFTDDILNAEPIELKMKQQAKKAHIEGKISSMGFIMPQYQCPDCRTPLKFDDDSDICYCYKCGCKVKIE
jgi:hypothetical protein